MPGINQAKSSAWNETGGRLVVVVAIIISVMLAIEPVLVRGAGFRMQWLYAGSALFVLLGATGRWDRAWMRIPLRLGLVACALGDVLGPRNFHLGVACFLAAHAAFCIGFRGHGVKGRRLLTWGPVVLAASLALVGLWLWPHLPVRDRPLITAYTAIISVMALMAAALGQSGIRTWLWAGAWIFYLSDIFVARWRFVDPSSANGLFCYPLYYLACTLLAWGSGVSESEQNKSGRDEQPGLDARRKRLGTTAAE